MWFEDPDLCFGIARNNRVEGPISRYIESHILKKLNYVLDNLVEIACESSQSEVMINNTVAALLVLVI